MAEVHGMIAVIVVTRGILDDRGDPDGSEAECLDVVELVNDAGEVATPAGVACLDLAGLIVPAEDVVVWVTIVEAGGDHEVDALVAEVGAITVEVAGRSSP